MTWIDKLYNIFQEVQKAQVFADQKFFADCTPLYDLEVIETAYAKAEKSKDGLKAFVVANFAFPKKYNTKNFTAKTDILQHIDALWSILTVNHTEDSGSLIGVPNSYIIPGGRFREFFYWDSYFTMLGLKVASRIKLIQSMVDNFSFLIDKFGFIPNGTRSYFLSRSQPPFYALMIDLLSTIEGEQVFMDYHKYLVQEYQFWMNGQDQLKNDDAIHRVVKLEDGAIGNRYFDATNTPRPESYLEDINTLKPSEKNLEIYKEVRAACESGWDFSSRWMQDATDLNSTCTTQIMPVDLNCLLFFLEDRIAHCYRLSEQHEEAERYHQLAQNRKQMINKYCWNEANQIYQDYSLVEKRSTPSITLAALYPLFFKMASEEKASKVLDTIEQKFLKKGGLITTLSFSGQQWDAPNAWAPLQYIACIAARNYNRHLLAEKIKTNWMKNVARVFKNTGKLMEKYNAIDTSILGGGGEYPNQDGFGWTNAVYLFFANE